MRDASNVSQILTICGTQLKASAESNGTGYAWEITAQANGDMNANAIESKTNKESVRFYTGLRA